MKRNPVPFICGLAVSLLIIMGVAVPAFAYSLKGHHMEEQCWYRATSKFTATTMQAARDGMATWNLWIPEYRRLCFNWTTHGQTDYPSRDGLNLIYKEPMADASILGENSWQYSRTTGKLLESDINLNSNQPWWSGGNVGYYDPASVLIHEYGHTLGLGHSGYRTAIMYSSIDTNTVKTWPSSDDIAGLNAIYS